MIFVRPTKTKPNLSKKVCEYLCHEKKHINELHIELNKLNKQYRLNPNDELLRDIKQRKVDLAIKNKEWQLSNGFDIKLGGDIRINLYRQGYGNMTDKEERIDMITKEWRTMLENHKSTKKDKRHVGLRPFFISPKPELLKGMGKEEQHIMMEELTRKTMQNFKNKFVDTGDNLSYIFSVHTDTDTIHSHVYLLPYTRKGEYLSMNAHRHLRGKKTLHDPKKENRINKVAELEKIANRELKRQLDRYKKMKMKITPNIQLAPNKELTGHILVKNLDNILGYGKRVMEQTNTKKLKSVEPQQGIKL